MTALMPGGGGASSGTEFRDEAQHRSSDDESCDGTAELVCQLAERARASRFRQYLDRLHLERLLDESQQLPRYTAAPVIPHRSR